VRRLALAVLALLVAAPSAAAQSSIAGGGSFNDAPVLAPGRYKDTLRGGEQLFYAVSLNPGQKVTAGLTVKGRTDSSYFMKLALYNPLREKDVFEGSRPSRTGRPTAARRCASRARRWGRRTAARPTASTPSRARTTSRSPPTTPGRTPRPTSSTPCSTCR
jgi:hypothetical protein